MKLAKKKTEASIRGDELEEGDAERHTFCSALYHDSIINMIEKQYCTHPLIPGDGPSDSTWIKQWAVHTNSVRNINYLNYGSTSWRTGINMGAGNSVHAVLMPLCQC